MERAEFRRLMETSPSKKLWSEEVPLRVYNILFMNFYIYKQINVRKYNNHH